MVVAASELDALNRYRERLFAFIARDSYKNDCGEIEVKLPGFSADRHPMDDGTGRVWLQVECYASPVSERTHVYSGETLGEAVARAGEALERWESGG
jgi:hypothetical protein